jgi:hypothetical protein
VFIRRLGVRLFQFVHIRQVSALCTYYICSMFWNINCNVTFQKMVWPLTLCQDQDDLHGRDTSVRPEDDQDLSKHAAYVMSVAENMHNASSVDSINSFTQYLFHQKLKFNDRYLAVNKDVSVPSNVSIHTMRPAHSNCSVCNVKHYRL